MGDAWTIESLKEYMDQEFKHIHESARDYRETHMKIHEAEQESQRRQWLTFEKRFDDISELLVQIQGTLTRMFPRDTFEKKHEELEARVDRLDHWKYTVAGRTAVLVAVIGILAGLLGVFIGHVLGA